MKVRSKKNKGRALQQEVGKAIAELLDVEFGKDWPVASREMGQTGPDVRIVGEELKKKFPYDVECKWHEKWRVGEWIKQVKNRTKDAEQPWLLFFKKRRSSINVCLKMDEFFRIYRNMLSRKQEQIEK